MVLVNNIIGNYGYLYILCQTWANTILTVHVVDELDSFHCEDEEGVNQ